MVEISGAFPARRTAGAIAGGTIQGTRLPALAGRFARYALLALAVRMVLLGSPLVHVDEDFYLLMGDRWGHGALPFVDVWDRKPIGLFALYRLFAGLPGDPVLWVQLAGIAATALTAVLVRELARQIADERGAALAGAVYVMAMPAFSCAFGQAPVFYNPLVALAMLRVVGEDARGLRRDPWLGAAGTMTLIGIALQIKYSVVFEGLAIALMLLARRAHAGWAWPWLLRLAALLALVALAPTLLALAAYAAAGHGMAFFDANFLSIFHRQNDAAAAWSRLAMQTLALSPFALAILAAPSPTDTAAHRLLALWALAALAGFLAFGTWFDHYVAPLLVPLSVLAAPTLGTRGLRPIAALLVGAAAIGGITVMAVQASHHGTRAQFDHLCAHLHSEMHGGAFFEFDGDPAFYRCVGAPIPTRYAFPPHLDSWTEAGAIGTDPAREVARIMLDRPDAVLMPDEAPTASGNPMSRAVLEDFLAHGYARATVLPLGTHRYAIWRRVP